MVMLFLFDSSNVEFLLEVKKRNLEFPQIKGELA